MCRVLSAVLQTEVIDTLSEIRMASVRQQVGYSLVTSNKTNKTIFEFPIGGHYNISFIACQVFSTRVLTFSGIK